MIKNSLRQYVSFPQAFDLIGELNSRLILTLYNTVAIQSITSYRHH